MAQLPPVVQRAIMSADVEKQLRSLAETHKLHLDQWQVLENLVMMTLLGIRQIEAMENNIQREVGVTVEVAEELTENINKIVFEPIREELERQLEHPEAKEKEVSGVEAARNQALAGAEVQPVVETPPAPPPTPPVQPATPPPPMPEAKVARPSDSSAYKPGETSAQRATVHDDPYREPPV